MTDMAFGRKTGRYFIYDDYNARCVVALPDHDEYHVWTEHVDSDGVLWYSSDDPDGYWLNAEEFGPFEDSEVLSAEQLITLGLLPAH